MKKVLILAYDFPPYVSVGGLRPYAWHKYLSEFGVEPVVVTRQWSNRHGSAIDYISPSESNQVIEENTGYGTIIRAPFSPSLSNRLLLKYGSNRFKHFRKSLTAFDEIRQFITISGPKKTIYRAAKTYLQKNKVDAIIATGEPFVLFYFAKKLSKEFNIPWIADYRDPWSQSELRSSNFFLRWWNNRVERRLLQTTNHVSTVSEFCSFQIQQNTTSQQFHFITNGYDPEVTDEVTQLPPNNKQLSIAFVGTMYKWHPWKSFLTQFSSTLETSPDKIELHFYGINNTDEVKAFLTSLPQKTQEAITFTSQLSNKELLLRLAMSNIMLLFNDYSILGTKIFDYVGIRRKIILCYRNDEKALALKQKYYSLDTIVGLSQQLQADLIEKTNSGIVVEDEAHLGIVLQDLLREFKERKDIACNSKGIENYSRKIQVKKLAEIIKNL